jgi:hypothetical protein
VNIYSEQGKLISGKVVSGRVNASIALTCKSFGGRPLPAHSWVLNGINTIQVCYNFFEITAFQVKSTEKII